jgi:hypothetical protein
MVGKPEVNCGAPGFRVACESRKGFVTRSNLVANQFHVNRIITIFGLFLFMLGNFSSHIFDREPSRNSQNKNAPDG